MLPTSALRLLLEFLGKAGGGCGNAHAADGCEEGGPDSWAWWFAQLRGCSAVYGAPGDSQQGQASSGGRSHSAVRSEDAASPRTAAARISGTGHAYLGLLTAASRAWGDVHDTSASTTPPASADLGANGGASGRQRPAAGAAAVPQQAYLSCVLVWLLRRLRRREVGVCSAAQ